MQSSTLSMNEPTLRRALSWLNPSTRSRCVWADEDLATTSQAAQKAKIASCTLKPQPLTFASAGKLETQNKHRRRTLSYIELPCTSPDAYGVVIPSDPIQNLLALAPEALQ